MNRKKETQKIVCPDLTTILAAELFSKLSKKNQSIIIDQIKDLLPHGEQETSVHYSGD